MAQSAIEKAEKNDHSEVRVTRFNILARDSRNKILITVTKWLNKSKLKPLSFIYYARLGLVLVDYFFKVTYRVTVLASE